MLEKKKKFMQANEMQCALEPDSRTSPDDPLMTGWPLLLWCIDLIREKQDFAGAGSVAHWQAMGGFFKKALKTVYVDIL